MPRLHLAVFPIVEMKNSIISVFLVGNAFVWYFAVLSFLQETVKPSTLIWVIHFSALILSALAGASFGKQTERSRFLVLWIILGTVASMMLFSLSSSSEILVGLVSAFLGLSLGFGMPACMGYFSDRIPIENRGRASGITMFVSGIGMFAFGFAGFTDFFLVSLILAIWRFTSLLVFLEGKDYPGIARTKINLSYKQVLSGHSFVLYFVPWVMFSLVNYLAGPVAPSFGANVDLASVTVNVARALSMGVAAVIGGFFADLVGRRRIAIAGFVMLGLGAAVLGFLGNAGPALYFNAFMEGIAWGCLSVLFLLTLWGDLGQNSSSDKYYALGVAPFFVSKLLELTFGPYIYAVIPSAAALFSFTAFFLFLAVLPLVYAPETLPEKHIRERELKSYIEKAKKEATKAQKKKEEENTQRENEDEVEFEVNQEDYEEAVKEAEKYY